MGEVWRATDVSLGRVVAVKVLRSDLLANPEFGVMFRIEAQTMAALAHPNVVKIFDYGHGPPAGGGAPFIVMSHVEGKTLLRRIEEAGRLSFAETGSVLIQIAMGLDAAHRGGIVHCDVKPANVLVAPDGAVTLVDFGVARQDTGMVSPAVTAAEAIICTTMYAAPEQVTGHPVSPATDIYALGAVAYHCLSGGPPFVGENPLEVALQHVCDEPPPLPPDVPPALRTLVVRAMSKDPALRHPTAAVFIGAVRRAIAGCDVAAGRNVAGVTVADLPVLRDAPQWPVRARQAFRRAAPVMSAAAVLLVGFGGLTVLLASALPASTSPIDRPNTAAPSVNVAAAPAESPAPSADRNRRTAPAVPVHASGSSPTQLPVVVVLTDQASGSASPSATAGSATPTTPPSGGTTGSSAPPSPSSAAPSRTIPTVSPAAS